jgi:hypothetical protein
MSQRRPCRHRSGAAIGGQRCRWRPVAPGERSWPGALRCARLRAFRVPWPMCRVWEGRRGGIREGRAARSAGSRPGRPVRWRRPRGRVAQRAGRRTSCGRRARGRGSSGGACHPATGPQRRLWSRGAAGGILGLRGSGPRPAAVRGSSRRQGARRRFRAGCCSGKRPIRRGRPRAPPRAMTPGCRGGGRRAARRSSARARCCSQEPFTCPQPRVQQGG